MKDLKYNLETKNNCRELVSFYFTTLLFIFVGVLVVVGGGNLFGCWGRRTVSGINHDDMFLDVRGVVPVDKIAVVFARRIRGDGKSIGGVGR